MPWPQTFDHSWLRDDSHRDPDSGVKPQTAPFDARFPNQNQTRNCYQNYLDFHRCQKIKGEDYEPCFYFSRIYHELCPKLWTEKWDEQRENGTFPGRI